jgi:hypothetical protein
MTMPDMQAAEFMVGGAARLTLSAIFLLAALHAVRNWPATRETLSNYNLLPRQAAIVFAWLLPPLQLAAAMALLIRPHAGAALGLVLMAVEDAASSGPTVGASAAPISIAAAAAPRAKPFRQA